ncbi:MAG: hypothetical protein U1F25_08760 [Rubrivivax sp.]
MQVATEPLPDAVRSSVIPGRQAMSDTHGDLHFARWDARNRLVTGGAILLPYRRVPRLKEMIGARLRRLWPQIGQPRFDHVWNGYVGMTDDFMPRFHNQAPTPGPGPKVTAARWRWPWRWEASSPRPCAERPRRSWRCR